MKVPYPISAQYIIAGRNLTAIDLYVMEQCELPFCGVIALTCFLSMFLRLSFNLTLVLLFACIQILSKSAKSEHAMIKQSDLQTLVS